MGNIWKEVFQIRLKHIFLSFVETRISDIITRFDTSKRILWHLNIINQVFIDSLLNFLQFIFWWVYNPCPKIAIFLFILWFVQPFVSKFVCFIAVELSIKLVWMLNNIIHTLYSLVQNVRT